MKYLTKNSKAPEFGSLEQCLQSKFGYDKFRPAQREIVESVLSGNDTFVLMPTGAGKLVCLRLTVYANILRNFLYMCFYACLFYYFVFFFLKKKENRFVFSCRRSCLTA